MTLSGAASSRIRDHHSEKRNERQHKHLANPEEKGSRNGNHKIGISSYGTRGRLLVFAKPVPHRRGQSLSMRQLQSRGRFFDRKYFNSPLTAEDDINKAGGIGGRPLKIVFEHAE
ncbi:hypothetical protein [Bradyrhizobium sp. BWA-3-5]|uniref:hypothetical protein n=1 Tax=Bradyrhizobium sp. BWA-3-5 TaxID=3080013 RepID=UPI00293F2493|nr:hypothetical protein [Bradyrhizobium sp. BWA-3-5]WOH63900.1 hypothetical protein RX331_24985 [Bradyrhizobium sp. BWA-3-5]